LPNIWIADKDILDLWTLVTEFVLARRFLTQIILYKAIRAVVFAFEKETLLSLSLPISSTRRAKMPHELNGECVRRMILKTK
jgi:hypothetical protein